MKQAYIFIFALLCIAMSVQSGHAQTVNITDGLNSYSAAVGAQGGFNSQTLAGANDILFQEVWFLIVDGQATRLDSTPAANIVISGNDTSSATVSYSNVTTATGALFDVDLTYQVGSSSTGITDLDIDLSLDLQSAPPVLGSPSPVIGSLVNYFDYDIDGSQSQTAVFSDTPAPTITQLNPATGNSYSRVGVGATAFDIASFAGLLTSLDAGTLLDSTPQVGLIDVTAAFQWDFILFPGDSSFNVSAGGFGVAGVPTGIPEPSALLMMSFGGVLISLKRSRKRS